MNEQLIFFVICVYRIIDSGLQLQLSNLFLGKKIVKCFVD